MTDEEMAEKYAKANMHYEVAKRENGTDYAKEVSNVTIKQAYLAGVKAGRPQWHKVADGDLPKPNIAVLICFQFEKWTTTYIAYYRPAIKKWQMYNLHEAQREPIVDDYIDSEEVIAWCEIPTFTDKETE